MGQKVRFGRSMKITRESHNQGFPETVRQLIKTNLYQHEFESQRNEACELDYFGKQYYMCRQMRHHRK